MEERTVREFSEEPVFHNGSVNSALTRIKSTLNYSLKNKYGVEDPKITEKFIKMHGLSKDHFDFINNFESLVEKGIADNSVDTNANKSAVSITGFFTEAAMPINKLVGYRYLYRKMKEMYGKQRAKYLAGEMYDMSLAIADSTNILKPYSYYGHTLIYTSINGVERFYTLKQLFEKYSSFSNYDSENDMDVIYVDDIKKDVIYNKAFMKNNESKSKWTAYNTKFNPDKEFNDLNTVKEKVIIKVWDDENGFVDVSRLVRHRNTKGMILYQTNEGDFAFVTEDHPIYMESGREIYAKDLKIGDAILDANKNLPDEIALENTIEVNEKLAYFLGFILGDGNLEGYDIDSKTQDSPTGCVKFTRGGNLVTVVQNDIKNSKIYKLAQELFPENKFFEWQSDDAINPMTGKSFNKKNNSINFTSWALNLLCSYYFEFGRKENSFTKHLPVNFLRWTKNAQDAFLAGLVDADGFVTTNGLCTIKLKAYAVINGIYEALNHREISTHKYLTGTDKNDIMFSVSFRPTTKMYEWSEKLHNISFEDIFNNYHKENDVAKRDNKICKIIYMDCSKDDALYKNSFYFNELEYVYDITTSTGRFTANGMTQHNCYSINASKLVFEGKPFGTLPSAPPQHLQSYIANLNELIHQLSNHTAGAIAVGSFFLDIAHVLIYREHLTLTDIKQLKKRKEIENCLQSFIHSMNHLSRNAVESPFVNISIFDRTKLLSLIADDNMGWYFDKEDAIDGVPTNALNDCGDHDWHEYIVKIMLELEDIYMNIMDAGDKCHNGRPITFPVSTVNLSRVKKDGKYTFAEPDFVDYVCNNHDIMRYNIYISEGEKIASCHDFENPLYYFDKKNHSYIEAIGSFVEKHLVNGKKEALIEEGYFVKDENNNLIPITGVFKLPNATEELIEIEFDNGQILKVTPDHKFKVKVDNEEKEVTAKELLDNPEIYEF